MATKTAIWCMTAALLWSMSSPSRGESAEGTTVIATYYHRTLRCQTCLQIEALARYDIMMGMATEIESGSLAWRSIDFETEEYADHAERFGLDGPSLVISLQAGGEVLRWVRLDEVWDLYDDVEAFDRLVLGVVEEYLTAASELPVR